MQTILVLSVAHIFKYKKFQIQNSGLKKSGFVLGFLLFFYSKLFSM